MQRLGCRPAGDRDRVSQPALPAEQRPGAVHQRHLLRLQPGGADGDPGDLRGLPWVRPDLRVGVTVLQRLLREDRRGECFSRRPFPVSAHVLVRAALSFRPARSPPPLHLNRGARFARACSNSSRLLCCGDLIKSLEQKAAFVFGQIFDLCFFIIYNERTNLINTTNT